MAPRTAEQIRRQCSKAGRHAHAIGTARQWDADTAREAGRKGGLVTQARNRHKREQQAAAKAKSALVS